MIFYSEILLIKYIVCFDLILDLEVSPHFIDSARSLISYTPNAFQFDAVLVVAVLLLVAVQLLL